MSVKDYDQQQRVERVQSMYYEHAERQIYEWVKTSVISLKQFRELNKANRDAT